MREIPGKDVKGHVVYLGTGIIPYTVCYLGKWRHGVRLACKMYKNSWTAKELRIHESLESWFVIPVDKYLLCK